MPQSNSRRGGRRCLLLVGLGTLIICLLFLAPGDYLSLHFLVQQQEALQQSFNVSPWHTATAFFIAYVLVTALSIPGATFMTLGGGAVFGLGWGLLLVSFASSLGATLAFLVSRYLLRDCVRRRFAERLSAVNRGLERDGAGYLLSLRLLPVVPFFLVNLLFGLTTFPWRRFYLCSQLGMLPATVIYVNAGTELAQIRTLGDVATPNVLIALTLLAVLPLIARRLQALFQARRWRRLHPPPPAAERNLVVIGAGSAGLVCSLIGSTVKAKVTLIENGEMGGDCLNTGCVPSKTLINITKRVHQARCGLGRAVPGVTPEVDFSEVMAHIRQTIATIAPNDSVARYSAMGVECIHGHAVVSSPYEVSVGSRRITTRNIVIATGARPRIPAIDGLETVDYLTSDSVWNLDQLPRRLLVIGGGPIGCELAQAFSRLGSQVALMETADRLLPRETEEASVLIERRLDAEGVRVLTHCRPHHFEGGEPSNRVIYDRSAPGSEPESDLALEFDRVLLALGRTPNLENLGLEQLSLERRADGRLQVNEYLQTSIPSIYACGDVIGPYQFTHAASHQAWYAAVNALFGSSLKRFAINYRVMPWCTFTDPEVARVGYNSQEADTLGLGYETTRYAMSELDRAVADSETEGFVEVLTAPGSDRILGVTIVGAHASDMISEFVIAMKHGLGLKKILATTHIYPTFSEANRFAASAWQRAHAPQAILPWLSRFHRWRRGSG